MNALDFTKELNGGKKLRLPRKRKKNFKGLSGRCKSGADFLPYLCIIEAAKGSVKDKIMKAIVEKLVKNPDLLKSVLDAAT
jgi:hypothetical protein